MNGETNLAELPWQTVNQLSTYLNVDGNWRKLAGKFGGHFTKKENIDALALLNNPTEGLLRELGNRLHTVQDLLLNLDRLRFEKPQLVLKRKFKPVIIVEYSPSARHIISHGDDVHLRCVATGFPYPRYQWYKNNEPVVNGDTSGLILEARNAALSGSYYCRVWNEIEDNELWSKFYRKPDKQSHSAQSSEAIEVTVLPLADVRDSNPACFASSAEETDRIIEKIGRVLNDELEDGSLKYQSRSNDGRRDIAGAGSIHNAATGRSIDFDDCIATDKVALIVCNSEYVHLPKLNTPSCDAETLADRLLQLGFKTVTLSDLSLLELKRMMEEYKKLLGRGVYALFYFVGHGFETRGQCYLLPVDAPDVNYRCRDCLCAEEALAQMQETEPSLNVILLDICRRFPPHDAAALSDEMVQFKPRVNRNTVFGYATSLGEGAYEVRGETNGVFMKYFQEYVLRPLPITEVLHRTMRALENDPKAGEVQFPEVRTNLSRPRSLADELVFAGHTATFDLRTLRWQDIHTLPDPVKIRFPKHSLMVTIWFDFCGHFTNMIYVFTSVSTIFEGVEPEQDENARDHLGFLVFPEYLDSSQTIVCEVTAEGVSVRTLLRHLQRLKGPLVCELRLHNRKIDKVVALEPAVELGELLIAKLRFMTD